MRSVMLTAVPCLFGLIGLSKGPLPPKEEVLSHAEERFKLGVEKLRTPAEARRLFAEAAKDFGDLRGRVRNPALCLSAGNAEALAGRWPYAIAWYHTGLKVDPNNTKLREHLEYARSLVNYPPANRGRPTPEHWPRWLHRPTAGELQVSAAMAYGLAWLAGGWWYLRRRAPALVIAIALLAVAAASTAGYLPCEQTARGTQNYLLVVGADAVPLHRGNGESYPLHPDVPTLPAGLELQLLHPRGAWLQVQLTTGEVGWVHRDGVIGVSSRY